MITLKEWMELVDYKITEGSDYYGSVPALYSLNSWSGEQDGYSLEIIFAPKDNQRVYCVEVYDYANNRAYRIYDQDLAVDKEAWDDVNWTDLESDDDFIQKALAIIAGEDYDTRVSIPVDIPDDVLYTLMKQAHDQDITFNQHMENILREECERILGKDI